MANISVNLSITISCSPAALGPSSICLTDLTTKGATQQGFLSSSLDSNVFGFGNYRPSPFPLNVSPFCWTSSHKDWLCVLWYVITDNWGGLLMFWLLELDSQSTSGFPFATQHPSYGCISLINLCGQTNSTSSPHRGLWVSVW